MEALLSAGVLSKEAEPVASVVQAVSQLALRIHSR